jgi:deoxyribodipyrimidine photo-lyase
MGTPIFACAILELMVAPERIRLLNDAPLRVGARYVLYWALINRRIDSNQALAFAVETANRLGLSLLVYEGLSHDHPYASERIRNFVLGGVAENARRAAELGLGYRFFERTDSMPAREVYTLVRDAAVLVTDDYPGYMAAHYNATLPAKVDIPYYVVDASCIVPMACLPKQEYAAYTIRPKILRLLDEHLHPVEMEPVRVRWAGPPFVWAGGGEGRLAALQRMKRFLLSDIARYGSANREPMEGATSRLSAHLHFGRLSSLEVALAARAYAAPEFMEQLIVRRELAFNFARYGPDPHTLAALPTWAQATLAKHDRDPREWVYTCCQFEQAATHDALWNAAQRQLVREGWIHGYVRMYWGKKIIEWSATHQDALSIMIELNDRYALDGRDPNGYTNVLWCLGLHDRTWTERPIFGMVRYMNLAGMRRKIRVDEYVRRYGETS